MWVYFLILVLPCMILAVIAKAVWHKDITTSEMLITFGSSIAIATLSMLIFTGYMHSKMADTEILNGIVTGKQQTKVSCEHSYSCNCRQVCSGSGNSRSCNQVCDTCYDHAYDWDWDVHSSVGTFTIDRVDRRGSKEPPRFTEVKIGEYAGREQSYQNPLLADDSTLFITDKSVADKFVLPEYPSTFDYYRYNPVIGGTSEQNDLVREFLKVNGYGKQLNIVAVITTSPPEYFEALMAKWRGGKSNDVIMVYGLDRDGKTVKWFNSNSYAKGMNNRPMHAELRQLALGNELSNQLLTDQLKVVYNKFNRLHRSEFEYKVDAIEPPLALVIFILIVNLVVCCFVIFNVKEN